MLPPAIALFSSMLKKELGWIAKTDLEIGLEKTINWYLKNISWLNSFENFSNKLNAYKFI